MKLAILSDAHGNIEGLSACLAQAERLGARRVYFLGDAFGYGEQGAAVLDRLQRAGAICLLGNHDAMLLGKLPVPADKQAIYRLYDGPALGEARRTALSALLPYRVETVEGRRLLLVHGNPYDPLKGYLYPDGETSLFSTLPFDAIWMGHTHRPFVKRAGNVLLANAGSCGLPRDVGDSPSFGIYDTEEGTCDIQRITLPMETMGRNFTRAHSSVLACLNRR